ncbi:MAG: hypothetical protein PHZ19_10405 [Candidatus Thermoplasmatota archaeon]|nr:hypothetical protein [Candidatus Thermoplasmatota archaeon]
MTIVGDDGKTYTQEKTATLDITVSSWTAATLSVRVIAMGPGSDSPAVSIMPMMLGMVSMLGMASYKMDN